MRCCETCEAEMPGAAPNRRFCSGRCRKAQYGGACVDCGTPTSGSEGRVENPRCHACATRLREKWTQEAIIAAIHRWAAEAGSPPRANAWMPGHPAREPEDAERYAEGDYPSQATVMNKFGRWSDAIRAAGYEPRKDLPTDAEFADRCTEVKRLYEHGFTPAKIAEVMTDATLNKVYYWLGAAGVEKYRPSYERQLAGFRERNARLAA